jgi:abequosyltransferase
VKLSICIPTYNFGRFIGATLDSIVSQRARGIEIVVLDGGSTDSTPEVVATYQARHPEIRYVRQEARGGIDRDMARNVELATGDYCWLFSSDDLMKPGALGRVQSEIESGLDVYLCGLTICDGQMNVLGEHPVLDAPPGSIYHLQDERERHDYFRRALTTTGFFSFMGSLIVKRERWLAGTLEPQFIGSCWAHVVRLFRLIPKGLTVKYLGESLLLKRGDNDSFMDKGIAHRFAIAIEGYHRIAETVFGDTSFEALQIRRVVANEFPPNAFFSAKLQSLRAGRMDDVRRLEKLAMATYRDITARNIMLRTLHAALSVRAYESARYVYRRLRGRPVT